MIERRIVRRYAMALFQAASSADMIDRVESDLGLLSYVLESSPALVDAISSPLIPAEKKRNIIHDIFAESISELTLSYLNLLVDKRREDAILPTEAEFIDLANEARGIETAYVTTAVRLTEEEEALLRDKLTASTGKNINLVKHVDPGIIGGVLLKIGDRVTDGSIKGQLAALKENLLS